MITTGKEVLRRVKAHNVVVTAAGIAFYALLALVPTLIALVSVYALVADPSEIEQQVADAAGSLDDDTKGFVTSQLKSIVGDVESAEGSASVGSSNMFGRWAGLVVGIVLALFSASGATQKLMSSISLAYEAEESRPGWKVRGIAYLLTAGGIFGTATLVFVIGVIPFLLNQLALGSVASSILTIARLPVVAVLFLLGITFLYRYGPDRSVKTPWKNIGALVGLILFILFAFGFSLYAGNVGAMPASYGLLGSVAALMIFLQLSALSVIIGSEVNAVVESKRAVSVGSVGLSEGNVEQKMSAQFMASEEVEENQKKPVEPVSFGKAIAGVVALFALGKGLGKD